MKFIASLGCVLCSFWFWPSQSLEPDQTDLQRAPRGGKSAQSTSGQSIAGKALVIDGDTISINGRRIRLEGIDAPEAKQLCTTANGGRWPAGKIAATTLERWVRDREVSCQPTGQDTYGRTLARCRVGGRDINAAMIEHGLAWAFVKYSRSFVAEERQARQSGVGIWAVQCRTAWDYRANRWGNVAGRAPNGCAIKGNITRRGRIYHMPWSPWYGRTRIEPGKGERWFCNERQALAAGWRPARVR